MSFLCVSSLRKVPKYQYIRALISDIVREQKEDQHAYLEERCKMRGTRKFDLIDLTVA